MLSLVRSRKLREHTIPDTLLAKVENLLQFEASAPVSTIGQTNRRPFAPYLEARMGALRRHPHDAFEKRTPIREVALLMPLIESKLQFTLAVHAMPLYLRVLTPQCLG
jgi:hypothetical protein